MNIFKHRHSFEPRYDTLERDSKVGKLIFDREAKDVRGPISMLKLIDTIYVRDICNCGEVRERAK